MGFSLKEYIIKKIAGTNMGKVSIQNVSMEEAMEAFENAAIASAAFWTCVNKLSNAFMKCEFRTYRKGEIYKGPEYYLWNVRPNQNQSSAQFMKKLISQIYLDNEALVVEVGGNLYIADSYQMETFALKDHVFTGVTFDNYTLSDRFFMEDVLYFKLNDQNVRRLITGINDSWKTVMEYAASSYKTNSGTHGIMNISSTAASGDDFSAELDELMQTRVKPFFKGQNTILPLFDGWNYEQLDKKNYGDSTTRDIKALADDIYDFTARAFSIPPALIKGDVQDTSAAVTEFITFVIDPLAKVLEDEINRKRYPKNKYIAGNYIKINTRKILHKDIFELATPIEKLVGSSVFSVNDVLRELDMPGIDEEWANEHFMTKNFSTIDDFLQSLTIENDKEGGENGETEQGI